MPVGGGTPGIISQLIPEPTDASGVENVFVANNSGVFFSWLDVQNSNGASNTMLSQIAAGGGMPDNYIAVPTSSLNATNLPIPSGANLAVVGSTVFFLTGDPTSNAIVLNSVAVSGGTPSAVATFTNHSSDYLVGDSNGLYMNQSVASNKSGIFAVTLGGTATSFYADPLAFSTSVGNDRSLALDATNLYWVAGGFNAGQGTIHAKAR
jgi:hypothetical protein